LILLLFIDELFFKFLRFLIYKLKNNNWFSYKKSNLKLMLYIQYLLLNIITGPLKLIFGFYYTMLGNLIAMPFLLFLLIRSFGLVLNILVISYMFKYIYNIFGIKIYVFLYIYLIILSMIFKFIDKDFKYLKIKYINGFHSTDFLIFLRNSGTICGLIINYINLYGNKRISVRYINIFSSVFKQGIEECFDKY
jgi:hypothetical protein